MEKPPSFFLFLHKMAPKGNYEKVGGDLLKERMAQFKKMRSWRYEDKIRLANEIIREGLAKAPAAILYSGGRDSSVLLDLIRKQDPTILVMYNNTGLASQTILERIRRTTRGMKYIETRAENPFIMWQRTGYWPILSKRGFTAYKKRIPDLRISPVQCCYQLKEMPANRVLKKFGIHSLFWGNRATESNRRLFSFIDNGFIFKAKKYQWIQCYPLQIWEENDIMRYIAENIPGYIKESNFESGCYCCGTDLTRYPNNLARLYQADKEQFKKVILAGFGEQILKIKGCRNETVEDVLEKTPTYFLRI